MTFESFEEIFNKHAEELPYMLQHAYKGNENKLKFIQVEVKTGGSSGSSCWGGTSVAYNTGADIDATDCPSLDLLIEEICPNISFIKYRNFSRQISWQKDNYRSDGDYYGNGTDYDVKYIGARALYDNLIESGILPNDDED